MADDTTLRHGRQREETVNDLDDSSLKDYPGNADPNGDGNPTDATIAGRILLTATGTTATDASITGNRGMGGQGILTIPVV